MPVEFVNCNVLKKENAVRSYRYMNNKIFIFNCTSCNSELKVQQQYIPKHTGLCIRCSQFDKPFKACYTSLMKSSKNRGYRVDITYEQFLEYTKQHECHYCNDEIKWLPHTTKDKKFSKDSRSYKLDRKDSSKSYSVENCVVCCWKCNSSKSNRYTYEEWYGMTEYFRRNKE